MTISEVRPVYRFDRFSLDLIRGALLNADGSELPLRPKSFDLLRHMVVHSGRLMDRDELMQAIWPGVFVTDDNITQCVKEIRRALGDEAQRLLRTVPRRGYLLDVSALPSTEYEPGAPVGNDLRLPIPATGRPMVVVMPFKNIGNSPEQLYLASGLTADLVADLAHFQELHIVSPSGYVEDTLERERFPGTWSVPEAASYIVEGSVHRSGDRIRVTVRLDDARTGICIWAERFDRPFSEILALQEELVALLPAHIVSRIEREATQRARRHPTDSLDAYDLCLRGRERHLRATESETLAAHDLFARAIELDPDYAVAHAWLAYTVQRGFTHGWGEPRGKAAAAKALVHARRAVDIESDSALCLGILAFVLLLNARWDEALMVGRAAVEANPSAPEGRFQYGEVLIHASDAMSGEREIRLALSLNPFHPPSWRASLGRALIVAGRPQDALSELRFCMTRMPNYKPCLYSLAAAAAATGDIEEVHEAVRGLMRSYPGLTVADASERMFFRDPQMIEYFRRGFRAGGMPD